jgi:hypothetical protein
MKTTLFTLSFYILLINSCNNTPKNILKYETLYIKTTTGADVDGKQVRTDTISKVTSDYFEVSLSSYSDGAYYKGQRDLVSPVPGEDFKAVFFIISEKDGTEIQFKESTVFLNFMSAHGYEMVDQVKNRYGADYTFKKK